jgi:hypothetical protein
MSKVTLKKCGHSDKEITLRTNEGRNCTGAFNSLLWSKNRMRHKKNYTSLYSKACYYRDQKCGK